MNNTNSGTNNFDISSGYNVETNEAGTADIKRIKKLKQEK